MLAIACVGSLAACEPLLLPPEPPAPVFEALGESFDDNLDSVSLLSFNDSESATVSVLPPLAEDVHPPSEASGMKQVRFSKQALALDEFDERLMKAIVEKKGESSLWPTYSSFSSNTASTEPTR